MTTLSSGRLLPHVNARISAAFAEYNAKLRLARATDLARSRRYLEAQGVLCPDGLLPTEASELDLLARIAAKQRHYAQAQELWRRALELRPGEHAYEAALAWIQRRAVYERKAQIALLALAAAGLVADLVLLLMDWLRRS